MARSINRLTARACEALKEPGRHWDGAGLYLLVRLGEPPVKSWGYRYRWGARIRDLGLGSYRDVSLAEAREAAGEIRKQITKGIDPIAQRKAEAAKDAAVTFGEAARTLHESKKTSWRNGRHGDEWLRSLDRYCGPIMNKAVAAVTVSDVLSILEPAWGSRPETASRVRGRIEMTLDAAKVRGLIPADKANVARWRGHLAHILGKRSKLTRGHHRAMPWTEVPAFMERLRQRNAVDARALEFLILCANRSGEVFGAFWSEFNLGSAIWVIPKERMKGYREHRVPLAGRALEILNEMARLRTDDSPGAPVFPGRRPKKGLSGMSLEMLLRRMEEPFTPHGFRSSFRDWCGDATHFPREIAEACLAHIVGSSVEQAYRRSDALEKRRQLLGAWAEFCAGGAGAEVVPFERRAAK